jgi:XTP/dITP diphosphohydrolase
MKFYLVTGNAGKLREAQQILGDVKSINLDLDELQGMDTDKISEHKARQAWQKVKKPVVVWDQSLHIDCLNGFPGPLIKWFWTSVTLEKICKIADAFDDRGILAKVTLTYYDGKTMKHIYGEIFGVIADKPRGKNGFAWDSIFIPVGNSKTFAEMTPEEKNKISMNKIALTKLKKFLDFQ